MLPSVTEQHRLASSLRFLAAASFALSSSFDYVGALADVADLFVPSFADGVTVQLDDDTAQSVPLVRGRVPAFADIPANAVAAPGRASVFADFPLAARGRTLGTLRVARDADAALDDFDRELFEELAVRIAVAIDSAQIYAREHHVADTLQRALLPERFRNTSSGGSMRRTFRRPKKRSSAAIGTTRSPSRRPDRALDRRRRRPRAARRDRDGRGAASLPRRRAQPESPSVVLERANTIVNMRQNPTMVTAIFGIIDPSTATITYAAAGHPAPILALPCTLVERLPSGGIPLGIADTIDATDWSFTIPPVRTSPYIRTG